MIKLFEPKSKIQKNRHILRDTDLRMAKYGRRGLISNFFIFTLCLFTSDTFVSEQPTLAAILSVGLLLSTILRGYFLFRIDSIYPRGPNAWRNKYFWATLLGACWWSVIMISITMVLKMTEQAPLMWLYTVVFFSTTAHAFSPYKRFLSLYQTIGIVPAALSTLFIGDILGYFYCAILLMFFWILTHHSELMESTYWDHLEANYTLKRKTEYLEEEKRDSQASAQLSNEYIELLGQQLEDLKESVEEGQKATDKGAKGEDPLSEVAPEDGRLEPVQSNLDEICKSIDDFNQIVRKDYEIKPHIFNIRHWLKHLVRLHQDEAETNRIEIETAVSPAMPSRLVGDAEMLGKILDLILAEAITQLDAGTIFVEMEYTREYETSGQLMLTLACQSDGNKKKFFTDQANFVFNPSLPLATASGWAETMGGHLDVSEMAQSNGKSLSLRLKMNVAELNPRLDYHRLSYKNKPMLLVSNNARWLDHKRLELDTLGFTVQTINEFKKATATLLDTLNTGKLAQSVVYEALVGKEESIEFANDLLTHNDLKYTHQFVICSKRGKKYFQDRLVHSSPCVHFVPKPSGLFEFEVVANEVFEEEEPVATAADAKKIEPQDVLWVAIDKKSSSNKVCQSEVMCVHRADDVKQIAKLMRSHDIKLAVLEHTVKHAPQVVNAIREQERQAESDTLIPIIAVGDPAIERQMLEAGVDQFVTTDAIILGEANELNYWLTGRYA